MALSSRWMVPAVSHLEEGRSDRSDPAHLEAAEPVNRDPRPTFLAGSPAGVHDPIQKIEKERGDRAL